MGHCLSPISDSVPGELVGWVLSGREHASEAFEGIQHAREPALVIISRTVPSAL